MLALSSIVPPDRQPPAEFIAAVRAAEGFGVRAAWIYGAARATRAVSRPPH